VTEVRLSPARPCPPVRVSMIFLIELERNTLKVRTFNDKLDSSRILSDPKNYGKLCCEDSGMIS
jgi:hypothetical protein